jgi:hypothetical protein
VKIRGQHFVWRYYLQAWADGAGVIYCLRDGKIFPVQPKDVAKERDFYRLKSLTPEDIKFLELFAINVAPAHLQNAHRKLLTSFTTITRLSDSANSSLPEGHELRRELDIAVNNAEEMLHGRIENVAQKYLDALRNGDASFFPDDKGLPNFMYFLSAQHFRTKGLKEKLFIKSYPLGTSVYLEKTWNVLSHIFAGNLGWSLYAERKLHQLIILANETDVPLLTADQPTINIHATSDDHPPERLAFYYPISPRLAVLLLDEPPQDQPTSTRQLTVAEVAAYNRAMVERSYEMVFSSDRQQLESIQRKAG